jgi:hypothetical protein
VWTVTALAFLVAAQGNPPPADPELAVAILGAQAAILLCATLVMSILSRRSHRLQATPNQIHA